MAKRTVTATVIGGCTAETTQRLERLRIDELHKTSTRTADCELFWLANCHMRDFCRSDLTATQPLTRMAAPD